MKFEHCTQEEAITAAAHRGSHAQTCAVCESVLLAVTALNVDRDHFGNLPLPDPSLIWRRAQQRAREQALAQATLPIRIVLVCSCLVAAFSLPWIIPVFERLLPPLASMKWMPTVELNWLTALSGTTVLGITATMICIALSSWFVLREQ